MLPIVETILEKYQVRRTRAQKAAFIEYLNAQYPSLRVEQNGRHRNLILGDPDEASVILSAHYDTPPVSLLPNIGIPYCAVVKFLYAMLTILPLVAISIGAYFAAQALGLEQRASLLVLLVVYYALFAIKMFLLPPNPHNANDNTSGIGTLLSVWEGLSMDARIKVALVFFDNEEYGCVGSKAWYTAHQDALKDKPVLNFDCVGDGEYFLIALPDDGSVIDEKLRTVLVSDGTFEVLFDTRKHASCSSDHKRFPKGIAVGALHKAPIIRYYFSRIHTPRDTILNPKNIEFLVNRLCKMIETL